MSGGVYLLVVRLDRPARLRVGRLGQVDFAAGLYVYAGSAQRGLAARLARHARRRKRRHWHVDALTAAGTVLGAYTWSMAKAAECRLAKIAADLPGAQWRPGGFGASDCRCPGHLVRIGDRKALEAAIPAASRWWDAQRGFAEP